MEYSAEHLFQLVTVFELQQIGLPADRAIKTVEVGWSRLQTGYGVAFQLQDALPTRDEQILGWIHGRLLRDLQITPDIPSPDDARNPFATAITARAFEKVLAWRSEERLSNSYLLLDITDILASVLAAGRATGLYDTDFGPEMSPWADKNGGRIDGGNPLHPSAED